MGLSVAIAGGIVMVTIMMIFLSVPNVVNTIFSIGEVTSKSSQVNDLVSKTKISVQEVYTQTGSPRVNFTLNNEGSTTLWDFDNFNAIVKYTGAVSGQKTEQLSYNGECLGAVPPAGQWCIQSILNDVADPKLLNSDEQARIRTTLSENLATNTAIVTVATDNGVTYTTGGPQCESGLVLPSCYKFGSYQPVTTVATESGDGLLSDYQLPGNADSVNDDANGVRLLSQTTYAAGGDAGFRTNVAQFHREWDAYLDARILVTNTTNSRLQVGFTDDPTLDNNNTFCNNDSCATVAIRTTDNTYQYLVNDGDPVQDITDSGIVESTDVVRIQVRFDSANNRVGFTINDNPEDFITAEIPADTDDLFPVVLLDNSLHRQEILVYYVYVTEKK
jgi:hypothetical protein